MKRYKQIAIKVRLLEIGVIRRQKVPTTTSISTSTRSAGIQTAAADISTEGLPVGPVDDLEKKLEEIRTNREEIKIFSSLHDNKLLLKKHTSNIFFVFEGKILSGAPTR